MMWMIAAVIFAAIFTVYLLFMRGASIGRSEQYQQELDDFRCIAFIRVSVKSKKNDIGESMWRK